MNNIKEIIAHNIQQLRKQNKLTQLELAEKLHYSDKAISRWESGDVVPDVEVLEKLANVFGIDITELFNKNFDAQKSKKISMREQGNRVTIALLSISFVWILATIIYVYINIFNKFSYWQVFILAVPATLAVALYFNKKWGNKLFGIIISSLLLWTLLTALCIALIKYNIWLIYIMGVPAQVAVVLWAKIKPQERAVDRAYGALRNRRPSKKIKDSHTKEEHE